MCGQTVAGLDVNSHKFSFSPPFFLITESDDAKSDASESVEDGLEADVDDAIATAFGCNRPHLPISTGKSTCIATVSK